MKVLLVVISTTTAQTGTVKISLQAYVNFLREQEFPITLLQYFSKEMQKKCE